jgi:LPS export ABC transporter permease LptF
MPTSHTRPQFRFAWRRFFPSRIDRYILEEVISPFLGALVFFVFIFLMFQALRLAEFFIIHGVGLLVLSKLAALMALATLPSALPIAFLISVLMAFGRLSADSEMVAMKASGIGLVRLSFPILILGVLVGGLSLGLNRDWCPAGERAFKDLLLRVSNTKVVASIHEGMFNSDFFDLLIFADRVDPKTNQMHNVFIFDDREPKQPLVVIAKVGEVLPVKTQSEFGISAVLKLNQGSIHRNDLETKVYQKVAYGEYRLYLKVDEGTANASPKPRMLTERELEAAIVKEDPRSWDGRELRGEYWRRIAMAIAPLLFAFLGIGFGTVRTRAVRASAILISMLTIILFLSLQSGGHILIQRGLLPAYLGQQIPNFVTGLIGLLAFRKAAW